MCFLTFAYLQYSALKVTGDTITCLWLLCVPSFPLNFRGCAVSSPGELYVETAKKKTQQFPAVFKFSGDVAPCDSNSTAQIRTSCFEEIIEMPRDV